ncbi:CBS domain-containing protein [Tropicimonas sp. IMCC6043]|uniref:CBS domain-containing protein n=1 Tax=Tropicimonas sp. IMCC6043 TaxID=2510645 RepID=UPI00101BFC0B|nr:CBS domain-containing protein [Tropicimonas sp. IMCC6043]RYH11221.1 CBS domain-containing protein [Tropicimonas sp. IMCC6043]
MIVREILKSKEAEGVFTVAPGTRVETAAALLSEKRIGSVVISADGKSFAGIISERDIVRELGKRGPSCLAETVDEMMTKELETCELSDTAESVLERMTLGRFRHMPVVEAGAMIGIITIGDVVKARLTELSMEKDALEGMIMGF